MLVKRGNPFFLEETVRTLIETDTLEGERGAYRLTHPVETLQIPATVQAILAARIDRLSSEDKRVLQTASVIGKDVPFELLKAITDIGETEINNALARLQAAEFVYEAGLYPDVEYTFKHALTHEVAYGGLTHDRKQRLHARIVDAIEQIYASRIEEQTERLAHHAQRGEVWDKAVKYLRQAGQRAFARSANAEAARWWEQALNAAEHLPEGKDRTVQLIDIRLELRGPLIALAKMPQCIELIKSAQDLAEKARDRLRFARALAHEVHVRYLTCEFDKALDAGKRAIDISGKDGFTDVHVVASVFLPTISRWRGKLHEAEDNFRIAMRNLEMVPEHERFGMTALPGVYIRSLYATALLWLGRFAEALELVHDADKIARRASHPYSAAYSAFCASAVLTVKGDFANAIQKGEQALSICEATEGTLFYPWVAAWLGSAYAHNGRTAAGIELISESAQRFITMDSLLGLTETTFLLPEAHYFAGAIQTSLNAAIKGLEMERMTTISLYRPMMLELIGRIHTNPDYYEPDASQRNFQEGLTSAMKQDNRVVIAHCHAGLGRLNHTMDNSAKAKDELTRACEMYRNMDMTYYLRKAEADLAALG
jgi:tetratricopeptide (TPR) repeat protein